MSSFTLARIAPHIAAGCLALVWGACGPAPKKAEAPPPPPPAYKPSYAYQATASGQKLDVTIGVVNPQFTNNANARTGYLSDSVVKGMLSAMGATFSEVMVAKGFNTKGPFVSLNEMTFPDKKGSDLLLYPEFDYDVTVEPGASRAAEAAPAESEDGLLGGLVKFPKDKKAGPAPVAQLCDVTINIVGNVLFVAQEPLSGERMWVKRLDLSSATQTLKDQTGPACTKGTASDAWPQGMKDAWAKSHEAVYQASMKSLDTFVNGEEFQQLKAQSQELRAKKAY